MIPGSNFIQNIQPIRTKYSNIIMWARVHAQSLCQKHSMMHTQRFILNDRLSVKVRDHSDHSNPNPLLNVQKKRLLVM